MGERATLVRTLAILPSQDDQSSLNEIFRHSRWNLHLLPALRNTRKLLDEVAPGVVIASSALPDGSWKDVLRELSHIHQPPPLIVASRLADERLWAEVLNLGGYDVLSTPFQREEVIRAVSLAWRHWRDLQPAIRTRTRAASAAMS
jgi:DNA-binding response OmpR family regulator